MNKKLLLFLLVFVLTIGIVNAVPDDGVSYLDFEDNLLDQWNGYNGTNSAPPADISYTTIFPIYNTTGNGSSKSGYFDKTDYATMPISDLDGSPEASFSMWIRMDTLETQYGHAFIFMGSGNSRLGIRRNTQSASSGQIDVWTSNGTTISVRNFAGTNIPSATTWYHIVIVYNLTGDVSQDANLYVNGQKATLVNSPTDLGGNLKIDTIMQIGRYSDGWIGSYFLGNMDDLQIYDKALSQSEINQIYNTGNLIITPPAENNAPTLSDYGVEPTVAYHNTTLNCYYTPADLDADAVDVLIEWYHNSTHNTTYDYTDSGATLDANASTSVGSGSWDGYLIKGDEYYCKITVDDGTDTNTYSSDNIIPSNTAPFITNLYANNTESEFNSNSSKIVQDENIILAVEGIDYDIDNVLLRACNETPTTWEDCIVLCEQTTPQEFSNEGSLNCVYNTSSVTQANTSWWAIIKDDSDDITISEKSNFYTNLDTVFSNINYLDNSGGSTFYYTEYLDFVNITAVDGNGLSYVNITITNPNEVVVSDIGMTNVGNVYNYSDDVYLDVPGTWTILIESEDDDGIISSYSEQFSVLIVEKSSMPSVYGWDYNGVPDNTTLQLDVATYGYKYIGIDVNKNMDGTEWNTTLERLNDIKSAGSLAFLTLKDEFDNTDVITFIQNNYGDLTSYGTSILYIVMEVNGTPDNGIINNASKSALDQTSNLFPIKLKDYSDGSINENYITPINITYIDNSTNSNSLIEIKNVMRSGTSNMMFEGNTNQSFVYDIYSNVIQKLRADLIPTDYVYARTATDGLGYYSTSGGVYNGYRFTDLAFDGDDVTYAVADYDDTTLYWNWTKKDSEINLSVYFNFIGGNGGGHTGALTMSCFNGGWVDIATSSGASVFIDTVEIPSSCYDYYSDRTEFRADYVYYWSLPNPPRIYEIQPSYGTNLTDGYVAETSNYDMIVFNENEVEKEFVVVGDTSILNKDVYDYTDKKILEYDTDRSYALNVSSVSASIIYFDDLSKIVVDNDDTINLYSEAKDFNTTESYKGDDNVDQWGYAQSALIQHYDGQIILNDPDYKDMDFYVYYGDLTEPGVDDWSIYSTVIFADKAQDICGTPVASCTDYNGTGWTAKTTCDSYYQDVGGLNVSCKMLDPWGAGVCDLRTQDLGSSISGTTGYCSDGIFDDSGAIKNTVLTSSAEPYGYMAIDDYCNPSSWTEADRLAWIDEKKSLIDSWTNVDATLNIFLDGYDIGDFASCDNQTIEDNFENSVQVISDYIRIEKNRKVIFNTYTQYQNVVHMADGIMKESCVRRWNGTTDNPEYSWEDWNIELDRYDYFSAFGIDVYCQGFVDQLDYESAYYVFLAGKILGYEHISINQPKFWNNYYTEGTSGYKGGMADNWNWFRFPDVGASLEDDLTDEGDGIYSRRYENGLIRINTTSHTGEFITNDIINYMQMCAYIQDTDLTKVGQAKFVFNNNWTSKITTIHDLNMSDTMSQVCVELDPDTFFEDSGYYNIKFFYDWISGTAGSQPEIRYSSNSSILGGRRSGLDDGSACNEDHDNDQPDLCDATYIYHDISWATSFDTRNTVNLYPKWKNFDISLYINRTGNKLVDDISSVVNRNANDVVQVDSNTKVVNMSSDNDWNLEIYDKQVDMSIDEFSGISVLNVQLNYTESSDCVSSNPTYTDTIVNGDTWKACYYNTTGTGYSVKVVVPHLTSQEYEINGNLPPNTPILDYPHDGAINVSTLNLGLKVNVSDPENNNLTVRIFLFETSLEESFEYLVTPIGGVAEKIVSGLDQFTNYTWYAIVNDSMYTAQSGNFTFITIQNIPSYIEYGLDNGTFAYDNVTPINFTVYDDDLDNMSVAIKINYEGEGYVELYNWTLVQNGTTLVYNATTLNPGYYDYFVEVSDGVDEQDFDVLRFNKINVESRIYPPEPSYESDLEGYCNVSSGSTIYYNLSIDYEWATSDVSQLTGNYTVLITNEEEYVSLLDKNYTAQDEIWQFRCKINDSDVWSSYYEVNATNTPPFINITSPSSGKTIVDDTYTITWVITDLEGDTISDVSCYADTDNVGYNETYVCFTGNVNDGQESCDTSNWASGNYFVWCLTDDGKQTRRTYSEGQLSKAKIDVYIDPSNPTTYQDLNGFCNATDPEGNNVSYQYEWYQNGYLFTTGNTSTTNYSSGQLVNPSTIPYINTTNGDNWQFKCRAYDEDGYQIWRSNTITVQNYGPSMLEAIIEPSSPYINDSLIGYCNASDPEDDNTTFYYEWYKDNILYDSGTVQGVFSMDVVDSGYEFSCGINYDDEIKCWGRNDYGQLGTNSYDDEYNPTRINSSEKFNQISVGDYHVIAKTLMDDIYVWGSNSNGQILGINSTPIPKLIEFDDLDRVFAGGNEICLRNNSGGMFCAGYNLNGQLGDGTNVDKSTLTFIGEYKNVSLGRFHSCFIDNDDKLYCTGENGDGQLGDGTYTDRFSPVEVDIVNNSFSSVSVGLEHTCAIHTNGTLYCWGSQGEYGVLGTNSQYGNETSPVSVYIENNSFVQVDAGDSHTLAIHSNGTLFAWGYGFNGRLGTGASTNEYYPVFVGEDYTDISAGYQHSCGESNDQSYCWGRGEYGRLGLGDEQSYFTPTKVQNLENNYQTSQIRHNIYNISDIYTSNGEEWYLLCTAIDTYGATSSVLKSNTVTINNYPPFLPTTLVPLSGLKSELIEVSCNGSTDLELDIISYYIDYSTDGENWSTVVENDYDGYYRWNITGLGEKSVVDMRCRAFDGNDYSDYLNPAGTMEFDTLVPRFSYVYGNDNNERFGSTFTFNATNALDNNADSYVFSFYNGTNWLTTIGDFTNGNYSVSYDQNIPENTIIMYNWMFNDTLGQYDDLYCDAQNIYSCYYLGYNNRYTRYPSTYIKDTPLTPVVSFNIVNDLGEENYTYNPGERFCINATGATDIDAGDTPLYLVQVYNENESSIIKPFIRYCYSGTCYDEHSSGSSTGLCYIVRDDDAHDILSIRVKSATIKDYPYTYTPSNGDYAKYDYSDPATILEINITVDNSRPVVESLSPSNQEYKYETFNFVYNVSDNEGISDVQYCELWKHNSTTAYELYNNETSVLSQNSVEYVVNAVHQETVYWKVICSDGRSMSDYTDERIVNVDNIAPVISISYPSPDNSTVHPMTVTTLGIVAIANGGGLNNTFINLTNSTGDTLFSSYDDSLGGALTHSMNNDVDISNREIFYSGEYSIYMNANDLTLGSYETTLTFSLNQEPNVSNVFINAIGFAPALSTSLAYDLFCNGTYYDFENDTDSSVFEWHEILNGSDSLLNSTSQLLFKEYLTENRSYYCVYKSNDGYQFGETGTSDSVVTGNQQPYFIDSPIDDQFAGTSGPFLFYTKCADDDFDVLTYSSQSQSLLGLSISSDGLFNATFNESQIGVYEINVTCTDSYTPVSSSFYLTINDTTAPIISDLSLTGLNGLYLYNKTFTSNATFYDGLELYRYGFKNTGEDEYTYYPITSNPYTTSQSYINYEVRGHTSIVNWIVEDIQGNIATDTISVVINNTLPTAPLLTSDLGNRLNGYYHNIYWNKGTDADDDIVKTQVYIGLYSGGVCGNYSVRSSFTNSINNRTYLLGPVLNTTEENATIGNAFNLTEGVDYCVILRSFDTTDSGLGYSAYSNYDVFRINAHYEFTDVNIQPNNPTKLSNLFCDYSGYDPDGDNPTITFTWKNQTDVILGTSQYLNCTSTYGCNKGETMTCNVTANDGYANYISGDSVVIQNSYLVCDDNFYINSSYECECIYPSYDDRCKPKDDGSYGDDFKSRISPSPVGVDDQLLKGYCYFDDPDDDMITYYYVWYKNGVAFKSSNFGPVNDAIETRVDTLDSSFTNNGDVFRLQCQAYDGTDYSPLLNSTTTTINTGPTISDSVVVNELDKFGLGIYNGPDFNGALRGEKITFKVSGYDYDGDYISMKACESTPTDWADCDDIICESRLPTKFSDSVANNVTCYYYIGNESEAGQHDYSVIIQDDYNLVDIASGFSYYVYSPPKRENQTLELIDLLNDKQHWRYEFDVSSVYYLGITHCGVDVDGVEYIGGTWNTTRCNVEFTINLNESQQLFTPVIITTGISRHYLANQTGFTTDVSLIKNTDRISNLTQQWVYVSNNLRSWLYDDQYDIQWSNSNGVNTTLNFIGGGSTANSITEKSFDLIDQMNYTVLDEGTFARGNAYQIQKNFTLEWDATNYNTYGDLAEIEIKYTATNYKSGESTSYLNSASMNTTNTNPMVFTTPILSSGVYDGEIDHYGNVFTIGAFNSTYTTDDTYRYYNAKIPVNILYPNGMTINESTIFISYVDYADLDNNGGVSWSGRLNKTPYQNTTVYQIWNITDTNNNPISQLEFSDSTGFDRVENIWSLESGDTGYYLLYNWTYYSSITQCNDGIDNDGDGLIDASDDGCWDDKTDANTYNPLRTTESYCGDYYVDTNEACDSGTSGGDVIYPRIGYCLSSCNYKTDDANQNNGGPSGPTDPAFETNVSRFIRLDPNHIITSVTRGNVKIEEFKIRNVIGIENSVKIKYNSVESDTKTFGWIYFQEIEGQRANEMDRVVLPETTSIDSQLRYITSYIEVPSTIELGKYRVVYDIIDEDNRATKLVYDIDVKESLFQGLQDFENFGTAIIGLVVLAGIIGGTAIYLL